MNNDDRIRQFRTIISDRLSPLIDKDYVYLDLPYHANIGDTLIWRGTEDFLATIPHRCLYRSSGALTDVSAIPKDAIIIFHGGGNFGTLYPAHGKFRNSIIEQFPDHRIIILPQTVYYNDPGAAELDAAVMRKHKELYICARDKYRYRFLKRHRFGPNILLLPDMAFFINLEQLRSHSLPPVGKKLLIDREDKEKTNVSKMLPNVDRSKLDVQDWPGFWSHPAAALCSMSLDGADGIAEANRCMLEEYFPQRIIDGVEMISPYSRVYSNRLHGAILSILLNKNVTVIDNSNGKIDQFYRTWLRDFDNVTYVESSLGLRRIVLALKQMKRWVRWRVRSV